MKTLKYIVILISTVFVTTSCADKTVEVLQLSNEFDGSYNGIVSVGGTQIGTYTLFIINGQVSGEFIDGAGSIHFNSTVDNGTIDIEFTTDGTDITAQLIISNGIITGSWFSSDGDAGTVLGATATDSFDGSYSGSAYVQQVEIGTFTVTIFQGLLGGTYIEEGISTDVNGFVDQSGSMRFNIKFDDGVIATVNALVADGSITGTFVNTEGMSGTISTSPAIDNSECPTTITDIDGNVYNVVKIGTQCWIAENLKTTRYSNGDPLITGLNGDSWSSTTTGAYAIYDDDQDNKSVFGNLYNWYAVNDSRGLCPQGWHIPTSEEAQILFDELADNSTAGGKLKQTGTLENGNGTFLAPNTGATDEYGFKGLPGGLRMLKTNVGSPSENGAYQYLNNLGVFWSSSEVNNDRGYVLFVLNSSNAALESINLAGKKSDGYSCRCIRD